MQFSNLTIVFSAFEKKNFKNPEEREKLKQSFIDNWSCRNSFLTVVMCGVVWEKVGHDVAGVPPVTDQQQWANLHSGKKKQ